MSVSEDIPTTSIEPARTGVVALGGAIGALLRFAVESICAATLTANLALTAALLTVNLVGAALLGLLAGAFEGREANPLVLPFLGIGVCGTFTTFSGFTLHLEQLHRTQGELAAAGFFMVSLIGAAAGFSAGRSLARRGGGNA